MASTLHDVDRARPSGASDFGVLSDSVEEIAEAVRSAAAARTPLSIRGGNTKAWYGHRPARDASVTTLDVRSHAGIVDYEPSELVIVARAGTSLRQIETLLAQHRQMLAFEPPHFATQAFDGAAMQAPSNDAIARTLDSALNATTRGATLGGCVAAGLSGPRRMAVGALRDFVLGARMIDGRGRHLAFGGKVMKNVAGYDVSRVLAGSLGTLGILTEVSLKVLPVPEQSATMAFAIDERGAIEQLNRWAGHAIAITAGTWRSTPSQGNGTAYSSRGRMLVRLEGSEAAVQSGIRAIGGLDVDPAEADATWQGLREQSDSFFASRPANAPLWRLALPSTAAPLDAGRLGFDDQLIEWSGASRWIATRVDPRIVRDAAAAAGGHATLWRASDELKTMHGVFAPLSAPVMAIHRRLKTEFDPDGLFNRGRLYPDL